jgi:YjbE family integral membrane protein
MFYPVILLGSIIFLDLCLSGDNAVVIAMTANGLPEKLRGQAISLGMTLATALRVVMALFATLLLRAHWIAFLGGVGLLWVAYKLCMQIVRPEEKDGDDSLAKQAATFGEALLLITIADVSMSLDNVLAVAALARNHWFLMILGIAISIYFLTVAAKWVSGLLDKHKWINWVGLGLIVYVAFGLMFGSYDVTLNTIQN